MTKKVDPWPNPADSPLERARRITHSYRSALHNADPERCAQLDDRAIELGQGWVAPVDLPAHLVDEALDAELAAVDIEHFWRIPAATIRAWASKGLLEKRCGNDGGAVYLVREVLEVESRKRRQKENGEAT